MNNDENLIKGISCAKTLEDIDANGRLWVDTLVKLEIVKPGMRILDFGAGVGRLSIPLQEMGCKVTAIERFENRVDYMKSKGVKVIKAEDLKDVISEKFDFVIAAFVFQHMGRKLTEKIIEQASIVSDKLYFTLPTELFCEGLWGDVSTWPVSYIMYDGNMTNKIFDYSETSYVYEDDDIYRLIINSRFDNLTKVDFPGVNIFLAEKR